MGPRSRSTPRPRRRSSRCSTCAIRAILPETSPASSATGLSLFMKGRYWHALEDGRIQCDLCPRYCALHEGQRGFCFVRAREDDGIVLTTYGRSSGFCVDPVEKKPLNHFLPGTS